MPVSGNNPGPDEGFGVYIHWPFCASKCPYCDFNSHVWDSIDHRRWRTALLSELNHFALETSARTVTSVFFGGGTPSLMAPETAAALIDAVGNRWDTAGDLEITLEANPSTAEAGWFRAFRDAGVNRLSIGVQSFRDENLSFLGRGHSVAEARDALALAADVFPRFSFDLIHGLAGQSPEDWGRELDEALEYAKSLGAGHLSLYQLTIEPGTPFHRDGVEAAGGDEGARLYAITQEKLIEAGLPAYEISNHARPGSECRHNLQIWRGGAYAGVGPGAHGRLPAPRRTEALYQIHDPGRWLAAVESKGHGTAKRRALPRRARAEELLMTGLRLIEGVGWARFQSLTGRGIEDLIDGDGLKRMTGGGFVEADDRGLRATASGWLCLNEVLRHLLAS
jgi:oxygen-independent coproporphyrinogen-3 oxidase|tara:strand:+ start:5705 stop:6886 length:1182 start_codon:yes stop_codon:yes gene_type:complete